MSPLPLALFGSINGFELLIVVAAALMIFGSRLPEVALRAVAHVMRARRAVSKMWRETGLEDELRRVRRDIELNIPRDADFDLKPRVPKALRSAPESDEPDDADDPDADRTNEPFDSSVTIEPADGAIASGEWHHDPDPEADRREPDVAVEDDGAPESGDAASEEPREAVSEVSPEGASAGDDDPSKQAG